MLYPRMGSVSEGMPTSKVQILDATLADQIAAGEVVERPSSVLKELVENALDAGATEVYVDFAGAGVECLRVSDNGEGMTPEDAELALQRHATSKIRTIEDLHQLMTLGFRGEALPSIASVSRCTLTSQTSGADRGVLLYVEGGALRSRDIAARAVGTTVEVRDLFFNVPARRKFLKTQATESAQLVDTFVRLALSRPDVRMVLTRGGDTVREFLAEPTRGARVQSMFAESRLLAIHGASGAVRLEAFLSAPEKARSGGQSLHVFVNGRAVRDRALARAIAFSYGSVMPPGKYPVGVVYLEVDPADVDVNVHPQKAEVRFSRPSEVMEAVTRVLAGPLAQAAWHRAVGVGFDGMALQDAAQHDPQHHPQHDPQSVGPQTLPGGGDRPAASLSQDAALAAWLQHQTVASGIDSGAMAAGVGVRPFASVSASASAPVSSSMAGGVADKQLPMPETHRDGVAQGFFSSLRVVGQVQRLFIVCEGASELYLLDQHAADERIRFWKLCRSHRTQAGVASQRLLVPARVPCQASDVVWVEEHGDDLLRMGFECEAAGPTTVAVRAVPALLLRAKPEQLFDDVMQEARKSGNRNFSDAVDMVLATMACHSAIRAGDELSVQECQALLRALDEVNDFQGHCPHGRPVVHSIPFAELERKLGR
jgi:DNA mismatch repair protein MutL